MLSTSFSRRKMATGGRSYSSGYFPQLSGKYGVGVFDVLPSVSGEEPVLVKLYYPTERKFNEVAPSRLSRWMPRAYTKSFLANGAHLPSALSMLLSPIVSVLVGEFAVNLPEFA